MDLNLVGLVALLAGAPAVILFTVFYGIRSNWRAYLVGRALMYFAVSLALTYLWIIVRLVLALTGQSTEDSTFWQLVRIILFTGVSVTMWGLLVVLLKIQRAPDQDVLTPDRPTVLESESEG